MAERFINRVILSAPPAKRGGDRQRLAECETSDDSVAADEYNSLSLQIASKSWRLPDCRVDWERAQVSEFTVYESFPPTDAPAPE